VTSAPERLRLASDAPQTPAPRVEVLSALRRHWLVAVIPVVVFLAVAAILAVKRPVHYTSTANLSVGHVYVSNPVGIPTIIEATQSLASVYSRAINATTVVQDARRRLGREASSVSGGLSATPIPQSPLIRVSAQSPTSRGAVALANAGAGALAAYINGQVRDNSQTGSLATRYRQASLSYRKAADISDRLARRYAQDPTAAKKAARDRAAATTDTIALRREALRASYQSAVQGGISSVGVEVFSPAGVAVNDRGQKLQLLLFVGLLGGLAAGTALALLLSARDLRRASG
jgi:capsular polysaccharide biosynthesis protein